MSGSEYRAIEDSVLGHGCCFDATVIDSKENVVCECFDLETAQLIADALNHFSVTVGLPEAKKTL